VVQLPWQHNLVDSTTWKALDPVGALWRIAAHHEWHSRHGMPRRQFMSTNLGIIRFDPAIDDNTQHAMARRPARGRCVHRVSRLARSIRRETTGSNAVRHALLVVTVCLTGCFFDIRGGAVAPTQHGFGNLGGQFVASSGGDGRTPFGRAGGGLSAYGHLASDGAGDIFGWAGGALHGRVEVNLKHLWYRYPEGNAVTFRKTIISLTTLAVGVGRIGGDAPESTMFVDAFSGIGVSTRNPGRLRWFSWAVGAVANRLWPDSSDGAWFVGLALAGSAGYELGKAPPL